MQRESILNASDSCPSFLNPGYRITLIQAWCPKKYFFGRENIPHKF